MDDMFKLVDERVNKYLSNSAYVIAVPCVVKSLFDNGLVTVEIVSNKVQYTVPNWSGSDVSVGENVQLFYRGKILSERNAYIGASLNKGNATPDAYVEGTNYTGALLSTSRNISDILFENMSSNILLGFNAVLQGDNTNLGTGTFKIYIDEVEQTYSSIISTIIGGYVNLNFVLPLTLNVGEHEIVISASGTYTTIVKIESYVWGKVKSAGHPFEPTGDDDYIFRTTANDSSAMYYIGDSEYPSVPTTLNGKTLTTLESTSFTDSGVKAVYIPEGITTIE